MEAIIDYPDANIMYGSYQGGALHRSVDGGQTFEYIAGSLPAGAWVTPYVIDPVNPKILYAGLGNILFKTTDRGSTWAPISSELDYYLQTLAVAPSNPRIIYTGNYSSLFKTTNGGTTWSSVIAPSFES